MKKKRLFVWTGFCPDHSDGLAFAVAHDEIQARSMVIEGSAPCHVYEWGDLHIHDLSESVSYQVSGGG